MFLEHKLKHGKSQQNKTNKKKKKKQTKIKQII